MALGGVSGWKARFVTPEGTDAAASSRGMLLRKEFEVSGEIASARIYASALGLYELSLNGEAVGEELLSPGWTSYGKRILYRTMDVTSLLRRGANAIGATVAPGWYKGDLAGWLGRRNVYGSRIALIAQLVVRYRDGREATVVTDPSWKTSEGPILLSEIYHGETFDARLEKKGWDSPGFDDSSWKPASVLDEDLGRLVPHDGLPVGRHERFKALELIVTPKGEKVLDFGQNIAGRVEFTVTGRAGDRVVLRHAEVLDKDGNFYTENLRKARARVEYVLKGGASETYEAHFTWQGFRYVMVEEWPGRIDPAAFTAVAIYSDMEETGSFECSSPLVNRLHANILWGLKGNFVDIPTDCPQRDERLGWTGDAQVFIRTASFLMGTDPFYRKWLRDLAADQLPGGGVPHVVPSVLVDGVMPDGHVMTSHSATGWGDAATICPWTLYRCFDDKRLLAEQYPSMKAWVECIRSQARDGLIWDTGFHFGDWVALDAKEGSYFGATPNDLTATVFYAVSVDIMAKSAAVLGLKEEEASWIALYDRIVAAFRLEFFTPTGRIAARTQTACVLALAFDLAPSEHRKRVAETLVALIKENDGHLVTGFLGTPYLCRALSESGALDTAYALLMREEYPSWLYEVKMGATTVWEHWDGIKPDGSMWSADMNSFNHYAYGSVGEWLHRTVAGLDLEEGANGYKRILFKPQPGGGLTWAKAGLMTPYGRAAIEWKIEGNRMTIEVAVPHNASAHVILPEARGLEIDSGAVRVVESRDGVEAEIGSGSYRFSYPWTEPEKEA